MNLFAVADAAAPANDGWKVSINVEPVMEFIDTVKYYMTTYVVDFTWVHWYVIACWMLSFFVVPVRFRSLGAVAISPLWLPFWLIAKLLTSVLAVRRANNTLALSEHYAASTAKVESVAPQIQAAADRLVGLASVIEEIKTNGSGPQTEAFFTEIDSLRDLIRGLTVPPADLIAKVEKLEKTVSESGGLVRDQYETIRTKDREIARLNSELVAAVNSYANTKDAVVAADTSSDFEKIVEAILASFTDKPDDYFVALGHTMIGQNNAKKFAYRIGVRLGALRNGKFNPQRDLYVIKGNEPKQLEAFLPNGLPVAKTEKKRTGTPLGQTGGSFRDDNGFLRNI